MSNNADNYYVFTGEPIFTKDESGVTYMPFVTENGCVGYKCTKEGSEPEYIYLNPSDGSDDGVATVFIYQGTENDPCWDQPHHHYTVQEDQHA